MPSSYFLREDLTRRWAMACSSASSRCLALREPDLENGQLSEKVMAKSSGSLARVSSRVVAGEMESHSGTYDCACFASDLSILMGSKALSIRSESMSATSTPSRPDP